MQSSKSLKTQLVAAAVSVVLSAFALSAATYAWYVANTKVSATTSTISATTNGFILQIDELKNGAQHGGEQKSLEAQATGATLSPSSTDDLKNWYVCNGWNNQGLVTDYSTPAFSTTAEALPGEYEIAGKKYNAYIRSDYVVYTITDTGTADVYLDASEGAPVTIDAVGGVASETMVGSLRVAITTQAIGEDGKSGDGPEDLRVVYAMRDEKGKGNDATAITGWTSIQNIDGKPTLAQATYRHIYTGGTDGWVATKGDTAKGDSGDYSVAAGTNPIATGVGYRGIAVHVYIWMEGTDEDCVNGKSIENSPTTYNVSVKLASVATS